MQFITLDQRIAVENFEVGVVYTVAFTSGDSFTGSCIGVGVDFVAFQRTAPEYIFCLTMTTAADIANIEPLSDDIGKILTYTGSVPATIKTDGSPLLDYLITGNTIQNGTPTPDNPIMPQVCGDLETTGEHTGQYKIPISSANTTTPVYLGEVQTTRKIKKIKASDITWIDGSATDYNFYRGTLTIPKLAGGGVSTLLSNKYRSVNARNNLLDGDVASYNQTTTETIVIRDDRYSSAADWLSANGDTEIYYVLANEETAVVNEPLMRIGDYADTLSYRQSGVNIPTTDELNIFDIDTTVKPSEVYLKYFSPLF